METMGKGKIHFTGVIVSAFVTAMLANSFSAQASGNCQSKLVGNSYNCEFNEEGFSEGATTADFETGGISADFDVIFGTADYGCACETKGSPSSPSYDSSSSTFVCAEKPSQGSFMLVGKVSGNKVTGQGTNASNVDGSFIFTCKEE
jgi:hypothetical protein